MWGRKKPDTPKTVDSEPRNLQANQPLKSVRSSGEETTKINKDVMRPVGAAADPATSRLGSSLAVKGEISGNEDLLIDGSVEGLLQLDDRNLTVGTTANVSADIIAGEVVIFGKVKGNVRARRIEIKKTGSVTGDVTTPQILIEDGAYFKGSIEIEKRTQNGADGNALPPAA
ncbi:MAG TPA: polymer-forming cytoskeletal protein [Candidatus Acidoferrum sp.]|jgi:cytoskeletal protein CcmA (bactofilin family)